MSALLDEIIAARKAKAIEYEEYLKRIAELAKRVEAGQAEDTPEQLEHAGQAGALQQPEAERATCRRSVAESTTTRPATGLELALRSTRR